MQKFVDKIAKHLIESNIPLQQWVIILPTERAKSYIQKALFEKINKPFFAPKTITINNWINSLTSKIVLDKTRLLLELYAVHISHPDKSIDISFEEFLNWGNLLLNDFDELERFLVNPKELFKNLKDVKDLEYWSFGEDKELTENQKKYLAFWERLAFYYNEFQKNLKTKNSTTIGSAYREVSENIDLVFKNNKNTHFLFAGFNALSKAETVIFKQIHQLGRGEILIDADEYYFNDLNHEAGLFLRKLKADLNLKSINYCENSIVNQTKNISLISCSQITGQVKAISSKLSELTENEVNETLILLADESLIVPLIQNIPKNVKKANITLGLPLGSTALKTWVELIFSIQEGKVKYKRDTIYYKDLLACWNHPFFQEILSDQEKEFIYKKEKNIHSKNLIFQSLNSIKINSKIDELMAFIFCPWNNSWDLALKTIREMNHFIYEKLPISNEFERAILQSFDASIIDFQNCVETEFPEMNLKCFKILFNQTWSKENIAYYGNPIEGLQIMGLLETRLLDFKRIFIVGMNEGKMPPSNPIQTLIPMDLRRYFDMPSPREKQGLFAHHFYRLLHHCEELTITYFNGAEGYSVAEKSRYISQIELELIPMNSNIKLKQIDYTLDQKSQKFTKKSVPKTKEIISLLDEFCDKGVSASKIKSYFTCPLDFYYKHILKFGEEDKMEEELESNTFGTIIHEVLDKLYKPFIKNEENQVPLKNSDIDLMLKEYKPLLFQGFMAHFNNDENAFLKGKNYLSFEMANELITQFLKSEKENLLKNTDKSLYIIGLEANLNTSITLNLNGEQKAVNIKGFIDRIDKWDNQLRIIDYKSGKISDNDVSRKKINSENEIEQLLTFCKNSKYIFQLLTYAYLYHQSKKEIPHQSAIYSLINYKKNPFNLQIGDYSMEKLVDIYPQLLELALREIYDKDLPFEHNEKAKYCSYCN